MKDWNKKKLSFWFLFNVPKNHWHSKLQWYQAKPKDNFRPGFFALFVWILRSSDRNFGTIYFFVNYIENFKDTKVIGNSSRNRKFERREKNKNICSEYVSPKTQTKESHYAYNFSVSFIFLHYILFSVRFGLVRKCEFVSVWISLCGHRTLTLKLRNKKTLRK